MIFNIINLRIYQLQLVCYFEIIIIKFYNIS